MTRFQIQDWIDYIDGRILPEQQTLMEEELLTSDEAIHLYLQAFEQMQSELPMLNVDHLVNTMMARISAPVQSESSDLEAKESMEPAPERAGGSVAKKADKPHSYAWVHHPLFHYSVAAAITLILFTSGMFEQVMQVIPEQEGAGSLTETLMQHVTSLLDALKPE